MNFLLSLAKFEIKYLILIIISTVISLSIVGIVYPIEFIGCNKSIIVIDNLNIVICVKTHLDYTEAIIYYKHRGAIRYHKSDISVNKEFGTELQVKQLLVVDSVNYYLIGSALAYYKSKGKLLNLNNHIIHSAYSSKNELHNGLCELYHVLHTNDFIKYLEHPYDSITSLYQYCGTCDNCSIDSNKHLTY